MAILKHPILLPLLTTLLFAAISSCATNTILLTPSSSPPSNTSGAVSPSFAGFGIEPSNLFSFLGHSSPNILTRNLLSNLQSYTGYPAHVRLGGNTADYMIYSPTQTAWDWAPNPSASGAGDIAWDSMLIGPRFFEAANRLPPGTPVTWGLNLAYNADDWADRIAATAQQVVSRCTNLRLVSFEIGNEPDLYLQNGFRAGSPWGGSVYAGQWRARARVVLDRVLTPAGINASFFEAAATASTIGTDFQIADLAGFGVDDGLLASWNQHDYYFYIGVSNYVLTLGRLLQLSTTETQFAAWAAQVGQAGATGKPYALREMGLVGPVGLQGVTDVFGAALWTLNFLLYAAALGVASVQLHMTDNSAASAWQPIALDGAPARVRPLYYAVAAFAQTIGPSCAARVAPLELGGGAEPDYADYARAYAVYQSEALASLVLVNARVANESAADKPALSVTLQLPPASAGQTLYLAYLTAAGADSTEGTTWNGLSFETSGDGTSTTVNDGDAGPATVRVGSDGRVSFAVRDSQAVVATLGRQVGSGLGVANATACAAATMESQGMGATAVPSGVVDSDSSGNSSSSDGDKDNAAVRTIPAGVGGLLTISLAVVMGVLVL
ncbi:hypothetical protein F4810DRAFT_54187 [Camillea tinctor]|nr:hypothetical protein F4810DRAFT_54187 [Camillea tinctor]